MIGTTKIRLNKSLAGIGALWIGATKKPKKKNLREADFWGGFVIDEMKIEV